MSPRFLRQQLVLHADHLDVAVHHSQAIVSFEHRHFPLELVGQPAVVRIEERDVPSTRLQHGSVASTGAAAVLLPNDANSFAVLRQHLGAVVGRAVVDDEHVVILERLRIDALERSVEQACPVVRRDRGGDERHAATSS